MKTNLFKTLSRHSLRAVNGGRTHRSDICGDFRCGNEQDMTECHSWGPNCGCIIDHWCEG